MALTWAAIVARALQKLNEESEENHWDNASDDPNLTAMAKEAERKFVLLTNYFTQTSTFDIVTTVASHDKPTGCLQITQVWVGGEPITEQSEVEVQDYYCNEGWTSKTGTPLMYIPSGDGILLVPIPDESTTGGLVIRNIYLPTQGDTNASVPAEYLEILADHVAGHAWGQDPSNLELANYYYNADPLMRPGKFQLGIREVNKRFIGKSRTVTGRSNLAYNSTSYISNY